MDSRASRRVSTDKEVRVRIGHQQEWVVLYNLSASGAMIEVAQLDVRIGDEIQLNLHDIISASGKVVWKVGTNAGVRFYGILTNYIVEHLGYVSSALIFDEQTPRDRFGEVIHLPTQKASQSAVAAPSMLTSSSDWSSHAGLKEDRRKSDRGDENRRREERLALSANARLCRTVREGVEGRLVDLSTSGCSFVDPTNGFQPGDNVWLKIDALQLWKGTVRWTKDDTVGIEFERPFYPAVLTHIIDKHRGVVVSKAA